MARVVTWFLLLVGCGPLPDLVKESCTCDMLDGRRLRVEADEYQQCPNNHGTPYHGCSYDPVAPYIEILTWKEFEVESWKSYRSWRKTQPGPSIGL